MGNLGVVVRVWVGRVATFLFFVSKGGLTTLEEGRS